ncbi:MAG TPA: hypothetical protein VES19_13830 [Candidatus Limnocylindrales bacterium]|nr:hypothetical protein [Candidatus Limnocylindrales bacterium]
MGSVRVPGFEPATNGFQFANAFPHSALKAFKLGNVATLDVGDAANGLCGGMSFSTADIHRAGLRPPPDTSPPASDTAAYRYIVDRQITSFDDGRVPLRFYSLMRPRRPERESMLSALFGMVGLDRHSRTWVMIHEEWPRIRADLDAGRLSMIGLVRVVDADPAKLGHNHQVVAYGYDLEGSALTIRIYDPNWPRDEGVTISLDIADGRGAAAATWSKPDARLFCFFRTPYAPVDPTVFR